MYFDCKRLRKQLLFNSLTTINFLNQDCKVIIKYLLNKNIFKFVESYIWKKMPKRQWSRQNYNLQIWKQFKNQHKWNPLLFLTNL